MAVVGIGVDPVRVPVRFFEMTYQKVVNKADEVTGSGLSQTISFSVVNEVIHLHPFKPQIVAEAAVVRLPGSKHRVETLGSEWKRWVVSVIVSCVRISEQDI